MEGEHTAACRDEKKIVEELCETFTPKMAHTIYIAFLHLVGRSFLHIVLLVYCRPFASVEVGLFEVQEAMSILLQYFGEFSCMPWCSLVVCGLE